MPQEGQEQLEAEGGFHTRNPYLSDVRIRHPDSRGRTYGAPVSPFTVSRQMGHEGTALVHRICGHLGMVHHRSGVVEYRVEQHREALADLGKIR